jgi:capsular exopolysaccharide synthesis family protein
VAVTSPNVEDGKTTTAINLAGALAHAPDARVLLVEVDFRRPTATRYLGLDGAGSRGLVDAILDPAVGLTDIVRRRPPFNLSLAPAGDSAVAPYEILGSPRLGELLEEARGSYDYIVVDTPPLVPVPDCRLIGKWVDGFVVVVAADKTPRKLLEEALNLLDPAKVLGLVFNEDHRPLAGYHYGSYRLGVNVKRLGQRIFSRRDGTEGSPNGKAKSRWR